MKKTFIICGILASLAIAIGIILVIVGGTSGLGDSYYTDESYTAQNEVSRIKLDVAAGTAKVGFYEGDSVQIDYQTNQRYGFTVRESDGTLTIEQSHGVWWLNWGIMRKVPTAIIKIPRHCIPDLDIEIGAGSVDVDSGTYGKIKADVSAGKLNFGRIVCADADCRVSAGDLSFDFVDCSYVSCNVSAGNATFRTVKSDNINIDVSAGNTTMYVLGSISDYTIHVNKSAGSCNLTTQIKPDAKKRIDIDVSAGSVNVHF